MFDMDSLEPCSPIRLPPAISAELAEYEWGRNSVGQSGGAVYRLFGKVGAPDLFLKYGEGALADEISDEMSRLRWLGGHVPMPSVVHFVRTSNAAWLLMTEGRILLRRDGSVQRLLSSIRRQGRLCLPQCVESA